MTTGKRVRLSLDEKLAVIRFVKCGNSQTAAAKKFGISRPSVVKMMQEEFSISDAADSNRKAPKRKIIPSSKTKVSLIEDMLYRWHVRVEIDAPSLNVTGEVLQSKALEFRDAILRKYGDRQEDDLRNALQDFKASNGWLQKYLARHDTTSRRRCGEHSSVDASQIEYRLQEIRKILADVPLENIWNVDETALQYRTTSSRSYVTCNSDGRGVKRSKERITVTPIVSAAGEKLVVQVIGKSKSPLALKNININETYNVDYNHQSNAWQDGPSMLRLLHRINREARRRRSTFYVLLDNCSSHVYAAKLLDSNGSQDTYFRFGSVVIVFFPPNATSDCQPLDQGIIRSLKARFRKEKLRTLFTEYELWQESTQNKSLRLVLKDHTHLRNALQWLKKAYESLDENIIRRCFVKANILPLDMTADASNDIQRRRNLPSYEENAAVDELSEMLHHLSIHGDFMSSLGLDGESETACNELIEFDNNEQSGSPQVDDDEIISEVIAESGIAAEEIESESDLDNSVISYVSESSAIQSIDNLRTYLSCCVAGTDVESYAVKHQLLDHLVQVQKSCCSNSEKKAARAVGSAQNHHVP